MSHGKKWASTNLGSTMPGSALIQRLKSGEQAGVSTDVEKVLGHPASSLIGYYLETENLLRKNMIEYKHVALRYTDKTF